MSAALAATALLLLLSRTGEGATAAVGPQEEAVASQGWTAAFAPDSGVPPVELPPEVAEAAASPPRVASTWTGFYRGHPFAPNREAKVVFDLPKGRFYFDVPASWSAEEVGEHLFDREARHPWELTKMGLCFPQPPEESWETLRYVYAFGWLADATFRGRQARDEGTCETWALELPGKYSFLACLSAEGIPLEYVVYPHPQEVGTSIGPFYTVMGNLTRWSREADAKALEHTATCRAWPPAPCTDHSAKDVTMYRLCDTCLAEPFDEDAGDAFGELYVACDAATGGTFLPAKHLIRYDLSVNQSYGPYQLFNYSPNKGRSRGSVGVDNLVGKAVVFSACNSYPQVEQCGQCTENPMGSWYSLPRTGLCGSGAPVGSGGCTWALQSRSLKVTSCVTERMKEACHDLFNSSSVDPSVYSPIYARLRTILEAATVRESEGGCPEVPLLPPDVPEEKIVV